MMARNPPPSLQFLFRHPAHFMACGCGSGLSPFAPGTAGTAFAWATYGALRHLFPGDLNFAVFLLVMFVLGVQACHTTGRHLGVIDHGAIVWDEIVPFWTVLMLTPAGLLWQTGAFLLFRGFDIIKPAPADYFDEQVHNGFGVMMDDVIAAGYTVLALAGVKVVVERFLG
jgi:phosphatidylglycerophosphatase A